jgi:surfeit locus 1 family protein
VARRVKAGSREFAPGFWPTLGAALLVFLTLFLARWQTDRGDEKQARQSLYESRMREPAIDVGGAPAGEELLYRRVRAAGEYVPAGQIFIDNQVFEGRAGFLVVTPLRLASGSLLLVQRGWIERDSRYPAAPQVAVPAGPVQVSGIAALPPRRYLELSSETITGNVWQNLSIDKYRERHGGKVLGFVLVDDVAAPGLQAIRERPDTGIERHREYALTWYAFAATALGLWIALGLRPKR